MVGLGFRVQELADMDYAFHVQAQFIQRTPFTRLRHQAHCPPEGPGPEYQHRPEIEVIPQCPFLAVYQRMFPSLVIVV